MLTESTKAALKSTVEYLNFSSATLGSETISVETMERVSELLGSVKQRLDYAIKKQKLVDEMYKEGSPYYRG